MVWSPNNWVRVRWSPLRYYTTTCVSCFSLIHTSLTSVNLTSSFPLLFWLFPSLLDQPLSQAPPSIIDRSPFTLPYPPLFSTMKSSLSSLIMILCLLLLFVSSTNCRIPTQLLPSPTSSLRNTYYCDSFPSRTPRSLCIDIQRIHHNLRPVPPQENVVDPRYGVDMRRVPTGPNPLHNWWNRFQTQLTNTSIC